MILNIYNSIIVVLYDLYITKIYKTIFNMATSNIKYSIFKIIILLFS